MAAETNALSEEKCHIITANRLSDGRVVWFTEQGYWSVLLEEAYVFSKEDMERAMEQAQQDVEKQYVVGLYGVELKPTTRIPLTTRERIRAFGPSTHPEFNPRAIQEISTHG